MYRVMLTGFLTLALSGCVTVRVDDGKVFLPQALQSQSTAAGQPIKHEAYLNKTGVKLDHFKLPTDFGELALTHATRGDAIDRPLYIMCMGTSGDRYHSGYYYLNRVIETADVLLFDYPGYNDSEGDPIVADFETASNAIVSYLDDRLIRTGQTTLAWGHSLGGFVCADIAGKADSVDAIVLEATAQNVEGVVDARIPKIIKPFIRPRINEGLKDYDVVNSLAEFKGPILVLGAGKDTILDVKLARDLAEHLKLSGTHVRYVEFPNASHEGIPYDAVFKTNTFKDETHAFLLGR